jgi:trehalose 6-phosphate phosphatase
VAAHDALFLDVDGTLLEIAATPQAVTVPAGLRNTLQTAVQRLDGALALISGRSIRELDVLFAPAVFPAAGQHGLERRDVNGQIARAEIATELLQPVRSRLQELQSECKGLLYEDKGAVLALHYRLAPQYASVVRGVMTELVAPLRDHFDLRTGKCVFEVVPTGYSKRTAIEAFMSEAPFIDRVPIFIGDDSGDEDGFHAVNALGGYSIRVGPAEATAARFQLTDVSAVIAWLDAMDFQTALNCSGQRQWLQAISNSA